MARAEVVGTFSSTELRHEGANCAVETTNGSLGRLAQVVLEFAVRQLDGIEVGRVLGQIAKRSAARFNRFAYASSFVRRKIVDHDDILALEGGGQTLFDVGQKLGSIH